MLFPPIETSASCDSIALTCSIHISNTSHLAVSGRRELVATCATGHIMLPSGMLPSGCIMQHNVSLGRYIILSLGQGWHIVPLFVTVEQKSPIP